MSEIETHIPEQNKTTTQTCKTTTTNNTHTSKTHQGTRTTTTNYDKTHNLRYNVTERIATDNQTKHNDKQKQREWILNKQRHN